ncbi:MAG: hypothetical protein WAT66_05775 [Actinomycetota bacterium]
MRKGVGRMRRIAAILSVTLVALLATGTGAGAVTAPKLVNFSSWGEGQVLGLELQLPSALGSVLSTAGLSSTIKQTLAVSKSIGQADVAPQVFRLGSGLAKSMGEDGTLNGVLQTVLGKALPNVFAQLGQGLKTDSILDQDLGGLIKVGVMKVSAVSDLVKAADGLNVVKSNSVSEILGLEVNLSSITSQLTQLLKPLLDVTDGVNGGTGLIDTLNGALDTVTNTVNETLGTTLDITIPDLADLLNRPLLSIGLIRTESNTGLSGLARTAEGLTKLAHIRILGTTDENALISISSLASTAKVALGGAAPVANAVHDIAKVKVLGNEISLTDKTLNVLGKQFPLGDALAPLQNLIVDTLGLKINVFDTEATKSATSAFARARTLGIELAPQVAGVPLGLSLKLNGPESSALIHAAGPTVKDVKLPLPTTGVPTTAYFLAGPALLGLAVLVRRFTLAHN